MNEKCVGRMGYGLLVVVVFTAVGCEYPLSASQGATLQPTSAAVVPRDDASALSADNPLKLVVAEAPELTAASSGTQLNVVLTVLKVQVPRAEREHADSLWNHLREDLFDSGTALRLQRNGVRVGVGNAQWWEAVRGTLNAITGIQSISTLPMRLPPNYPLAVELDTAPREQTLFYMAEDGILTGETWPQSRNVLRMSYELDLEHPERIRLMVVPEVRQKLNGWRWVKSVNGLTQLPNYGGRAFGVAGFLVDLEPGEFLLIAPGEQSKVFGLVGNAFLVCEEDGRRYDSYVFLRADVNHVVQGN